MTKHSWLDKPNWAVVGASTRTDSYGNIITGRLKDEGFNVIPISHKYAEVQGLQAYKSLKDYDGPIDVVDFVVNPTIGMKVLDDVIALGVKRILLQPGTASEALVQKAESHGIEVLQGCVLVLLNWR